MGHIAAPCRVVCFVVAALSTQCRAAEVVEWHDSGLSLLQHSAAKLPALHAAPPWANISKVLGACVPHTLVPRYGRCLFGDQCATGFCSPFFRVCLADDKDKLPPKVARADKVLKRILWQTCKGRHKDCRTCEFLPHSLEDFQICAEDPFSPRRPSLSLFDPSDPTCGCHDDFVSLYRTQAWVDCGQGSTQQQLQVMQGRRPSSPCESAGKACTENSECSATLEDLEGLRSPADRLSTTFASCEHKDALLLLLQMWIACPLPDGADVAIRTALADVRAEMIKVSFPDRHVCSFVGMHQPRLAKLLPLSDLVEGSDVIRQLNPERTNWVLSAERQASHKFMEQTQEEVLTGQ